MKTTLPTLLPEIPEWARGKIDPKRVAGWERARREWALEWDDATKAKMWPRILAVNRNNLIEALDVMRDQTEAEYASAVARWKAQKETP